MTRNIRFTFFPGTQTNYGKHFFIAFTSRYRNRKSDHMDVYLTALDETNVTIHSQQSGRQMGGTAYIEKGGFFTFKLPTSWRMRQIERFQKGIEIRSSADISVLCLNVGDDSTAEGNLALPTVPNALGSSYFVASYKPFCMYCSANIAIISEHYNNRIQLSLNRNVTFYSRSGKIIDGNAGIINVPLQKGDALYVSTQTDLSATTIFARKPVTVISGLDNAGMFGSYGFSEATLLPVDLWGYEYILTTIGTVQKTHGDIFRIFVSKNNTVVKCSYWTKVLSSGTYVEMMLEKDLASYVKCSNPCQVVQYIRSESIYWENKISSMMALPSVSQFLSFYHVTLPAIGYFFYSITIVIEKENINGLYGDGLKLSKLRWKGINGTKYVWTVIDLPHLSKVTVYHISSSVKFGLFVFGWNDQSSYGYPGGFSLRHQSHGKLLTLLFLNQNRNQLN